MATRGRQHVPQIQTKSISGSRHYVHPKTGEQVPSVTTILGVVNKPALPRWAAKMTAEYAVANRKTWESLDDRAATELLKGSPWRSMNDAADKGTSIHGIAEKLLRGERIEYVQPGTEHACQSVAEFITAVQPKPVGIEVTVWSHKHKYAGTLDLLAMIDDELWLIDWKSSKGVYADFALQLAAYAMADEIIYPDGRSIDMPKIEKAAIAHVPKEGGWAFVELDVGEHARQAFMHARGLFEWQSVHSGKAVGASLSTSPQTAQTN